MRLETFLFYTERMIKGTNLRSCKLITEAGFLMRPNTDGRRPVERRTTVFSTECMVDCSASRQHATLIYAEQYRGAAASSCLRPLIPRTDFTYSKCQMHTLTFTDVGNVLAR